MSRSFFRRLFDPPAAPPPHREARHAMDLCVALLAARDEVSVARLTAAVLTHIQSLSPAALGLFVDLLAEELSPSPAAVEAAAAAYVAAPTPNALISLQRAVDPPRRELFSRLVTADGAIRTLVETRRRVLETLPDNPQRLGVDADLLHLFRLWFNRGLLILRRIDWHTSAVILERLIEYEAVHQIQGWNDLRRRLEADRRCYAFFHPTWPLEPLIFIEVALTRGMSAAVQPLLNPASPVLDPAAADSAMFYSITNCQEGLRGVSFGSFLIRQVVEDLGRSLRKLRTFATLSPIPGFRQWIEGESGAGRESVSAELAAVLAQGRAGDVASARLETPGLRSELPRLCARYLLHAKRSKAPLDPVARFHLASGARLDRINWLADISPAGIQRSLGLMANYVYQLDEIENNHEGYARDGRVAASAQLQRWARREGDPPGARVRLTARRAKTEAGGVPGSRPAPEKH